jgi:cyclase
MLKPRIIPCLLVHDRGLVKTTCFKDPKYIGDPLNAVKIFNEKEADELIVLDIDATINSSEPDYTMIALLAAECRMPLCYGGGVRGANQARKIISLGVEKVAISSAALESPNLISEISEEIGSQSVVVVLDVKKRMFGLGYDVWTHNGTRNSKKNVFDFAKLAQELGAGEIVINSIDNDGMMKGFDLALAEKVRKIVNIPITILGGAGQLQHFTDVIDKCGVVGIAAGSFFVFKGPYRAVLISYPDSSLKNSIFAPEIS